VAVPPLHLRHEQGVDLRLAQPVAWETVGVLGIAASRRQVAGADIPKLVDLRLRVEGDSAVRVV
jgi:hypothetical protein